MKLSCAINWCAAMSSGYSYSTYTHWDLWVPIGVSVLTVALTALAVASSTAWYRLHRITAHHSLELAYHFSRLVLGDSLQREIKSQPPCLTLFDREISPLATIFLAALSPALLIPAFVSFWASFLIKETFSCDPGLDCFFRNPSSFAIEDHGLPLYNCSDFDENNATVICFQFVFDYAAGFASMGGLIVVAVSSLRVYAIVLVWLVGVMPSATSDKSRRCYSCRTLSSVVCVFIFFLAPVIIAIVILTAVLLVPFVNDIVFQSSEHTLQFATYWTSLLFSGTLTGVCLLAALLGSRLHQHTYTTGEAPEADFTASFVMTATNPRSDDPGRSNATTTTTNLNSLYLPGKTEAQPVPAKPEELDLKPPKLVGSVFNSYRDVTDLSPQHSESSQLLCAPGKTVDYHTT